VRSIIVRPTDVKVSRYGQRMANAEWYLPYRTRSKKARFEGYAVNRNTLIDIFSNLHHYASHAPKAVAKRWRAAEYRFVCRHMGARRGTARFLNEYTAHAWM
jgi:hypothetical protein